MARKGIFSASLERTLSGGDEPQEAPSPAVSPVSAAPASGSPTVRRFRETYDDLRNQTIQDIDIDLIGQSKFRDRFDVSAEIDTLVASIRESGQQVPVLLRAAPAGSGYEYEPVYGRRRIAACRIIGIPVKAYIGELDDDALVVAQGLENAERLENSYIEKSAFITQLLDSGMKAAVIERALNIPTGDVSRMAKVIREIPSELIDAIGSAHGIGRRQWGELAKITAVVETRRIKKAVEALPNELDSPGRFTTVLQRLKGGSEQRSSKPKKLSVAKGQVEMSPSTKGISIKVKDKSDAAFIEWLQDETENLYWQWKSANE
ncbi:plasmid partitioning protein RepB-21 (plasmid) [Sulfitobacter sp. DSM 110093]|uniref:plasmid partitioning protein RepB n=1 Tax=Sulfitobacter sp. DSM 110093 TaxID=2883127 RepID=UPI001FAD096D|nr:plasmid partitioning protein RepB [Sulfitobacter sp. DSM 110093]UOA33570.1 plasmid partitioning protein RepB-21 [Sulfitobacter sp. DSM 110093]